MFGENIRVFMRIRSATCGVETDRYIRFSIKTKRFYSTLTTFLVANAVSVAFKELGKMGLSLTASDVQNGNSQS